MSNVLSWCSNITQMFTLVKLKNYTNITSTPEQPHSIFNPPPNLINCNLQRSLFNVTLNPFLQWIPPISRDHFLSTDSTTGGMMGVVGRAKRHREACPWGRGSGITWLGSRSSVSVPVGWTWRRGSAIRDVTRWPGVDNSASHLQFCKRPWTGFPDVLTLPQDRPAFLLSPEDFPWCCATERKELLRIMCTAFSQTFNDLKDKT